MSKEPENKGAEEASWVATLQLCKAISPNFLNQILKHNLVIALNITQG